MEYKVQEEKQGFIKRSKRKTRDFLQSLFGPFIILLAKLLGIETGYKEGEKLILVADYGKIPAKTKVTFLKLSDAGNPFAGPSLVAVKHEGKTIVLPEHFVKERSYLKRALTAYEFNAKMIEGNRRLGKSHPYLIPRIGYILYYLPQDLWAKIRRKED